MRKLGEFSRHQEYAHGVLHRVLPSLNGLENLMGGGVGRNPEIKNMHETAILAEHALADWGRDEEDEAWAHLQPDQ